MQLTEVTYTEGTPIDGYGPGFFRIGGEVVKGAILILPEGLFQWGGYDDVDDLTANQLNLDVLFVGTGAEISPIPAAFRTRVENLDIGVEVMNSPTACRTYNVLLSEGRRIGLALLPV